MRRNAFGEAYCETADELVQELNDHADDCSASNCFVDIFADEDAAEGAFVAEIKRNTDAEVVCYVENVNGREDMEALLHKAGFAPGDINFID